MRKFPPKKKSALPSDIEIDIDRFSHDGRGIGHFQGRVVMVANALPGERCVVRIEQAKSKLWQGKAVKTLNASPERINPACPHYDRCGGCQQQHLPHETQIELKQNTIREQFSRQQLNVKDMAEPIVSSPFEYRHRARFHVAGNGAIGFHSEKANQVVELTTCKVLTPALHSAFEQLREQAPLRFMEQLEIVVDDFGQIGLCAIKGKTTAMADLEAWARAQLWVVHDRLNYQSGDHVVFAKPGEFTQVNRPVNAHMIQQLASWLSLTKEDQLLDLFCGNGNIGLALANQVKAVLGLESSAAAIEQAQAASESLKNANFLVENLFTADLHQINEVQNFAPSLVVLDPPRAGAERVCQTISKIPSVRRILYVSCDPATMARDIRHLVDNKWHLSKVGLIDMFPQTRHIETMALLEK